MADTVQRFEFKPALMRERNNWTLDGGFLTCNGELFSDLNAITSARFAELHVRHTYSTWLDLNYEGGRHRIACNMPPGDKNHTAFLQLTAATLSELAERKPDMKVTFGTVGAVRWALFLIGFAAGLFGLGILAFMLSGGTDRGDGLFVFLFGGAFLLFGGAMAWIYRPWAPPATLPVTRARDLVSRLALHHKPESGEDESEQPEEDKG